VTHIPTESVRTSTQCRDKWDKMKNTYFQEKTIEGVTSSTTILWVWFDKMNQILESRTKANGTPNGLDQGYAHANYSCIWHFYRYI